MKTSFYSFLILAAFASAHPKGHPTSHGYAYLDGSRRSSYLPSQPSSYTNPPSATGFPSTPDSETTTPPSATSRTNSPNPPSPSELSALTNSTLSSIGISLPPGCSTKNNIAIGWLPDADKGVPLSAITTTTTTTLPSHRPCFVGYYAQITSPKSFSSSQLLSKIPQLTALGPPYPIFVASVMPSIPMAEVPNVAASIAHVMREMTDAGLTVWLRFAHEMNWYDSAPAGYVYPQSSIASYQTAWTAVSSAVRSNPSVKMFWSPNSASAAELKTAGWYPPRGAVDIIGVDIYPKGRKSFADVYGDFCSGWPDVPFAIGETGSGPDKGDKMYWLGQLVSEEAKRACPNYVGFSWFEYDKEEDFRVATGGHREAVGVLGK